MAVYKHTYQRYEGRLTPAWSRFLILPRYTLQQAFRSKFLISLMVAGLAWPLGCALVIYLHHNLSALKILNLNPDKLMAIDSHFFYVFLWVQSGIGFLLTAFVGPGLVSPDLANNGLPLYLSRPFSRAEYVLGKLSVIAILLSVITWLPGIVLFFLQCGLEGIGWCGDNLRVLMALLLGSWLWIAWLSLFSLVLSAWVKWRFVAGALLFGIISFANGMGAAINNIFDTKAGFLINLSEVMQSIWSSLFGLEGKTAVAPDDAWRSLLAFCAICLFLLSRKIKAYEVIK
jgi:ABC-2 type transport system permease protein